MVTIKDAGYALLRRQNFLLTQGKGRELTRTVRRVRTDRIAQRTLRGLPINLRARAACGSTEMILNRPHYLLLSESRSHRLAGADSTGHWRFVLESTNGHDRFEAGDCEPAVGGERLELLTVIRGLEALDQPSQVTLVTPSRYVSRGLRYGLNQWRRNDWRWEYDGRMIPVTNHDLWQRLDRALQYHDVRCRWLRTDPWPLPRTACHAGERRSRWRSFKRRYSWQVLSQQIRHRLALLLWVVSARVGLGPAA
jgi:ribonuclease HI